MQKIKTILYMSVLPLVVAIFSAIGDINLLACKGFSFEVEIPEELK